MSADDMRLLGNKAFEAKDYLKAIKVRISFHHSNVPPSVCVPPRRSSAANNSKLLSVRTIQSSHAIDRALHRTTLRFFDVYVCYVSIIRTDGCSVVRRRRHGAFVFQCSRPLDTMAREFNSRHVPGRRVPRVPLTRGTREHARARATAHELYSRRH
jgi:hypothetical protein